jgi:hypothetical protein
LHFPFVGGGVSLYKSIGDIAPRAYGICMQMLPEWQSSLHLDAMSAGKERKFLFRDEVRVIQMT